VKYFTILTISSLLVLLLVAYGSTPVSSQHHLPKVEKSTLAIATCPVVDVARAIYEVVYSRNQHAIFVAAPDRTKFSRSLLLRLDPETLAVQATVTLPHVGFSLTLDELRNLLYIGHGSEGFVSVVDVASNSLIDTIALEPESNHFPYHVRALRLDKSGKRLYVPGIRSDPGGDSVLFVLETVSFKLIKTIPGFGFHGIGIAVDDSRNRVLVGNGEGLIKQVDTKSLTITGVFEVNTGTRLFNLALSTNGKYLYATDSGAVEDKQAFRERYPNQRVMGDIPRTAVFDAASGAELVSFTTGETAAPSLAMVEDGKRQRLYVSNRGDGGYGSVSVYDTSSSRLLGIIELPAHPNSLALDELHNVLYVSIKNDIARDKAHLLERITCVKLK
jgi:DNA-binding beta-propeller fold protein YncE